MLTLLHYINVTLCYAHIDMVSFIMLMALHSITLTQLHYANVIIHFIMVM